MTYGIALALSFSVRPAKRFLSVRKKEVGVVLVVGDGDGVDELLLVGCVSAGAVADGSTTAAGGVPPSVVTGEGVVEEVLPLSFRPESTLDVDGAEESLGVVAGTVVLVVGDGDGVIVGCLFSGSPAMAGDDGEFSVVVSSPTCSTPGTS